MEEKRKKIVKGKGKIENGRRENFHFSKWLKFVFGLPKWKNFYLEKAFHTGKKIRKNDFAPSEKITLTPLYAWLYE